MLTRNIQGRHSHWRPSGTPFTFKRPPAIWVSEGVRRASRSDVYELTGTLPTQPSRAAKMKWCSALLRRECQERLKCYSFRLGDFHMARQKSARNVSNICHVCGTYSTWRRAGERT